MKLRHRYQVLEAELWEMTRAVVMLLVAMVCRTACDGFRVGKVVESNDDWKRSKE